MRLNQYIAQATGLSRRAADSAIVARRVRVNHQSGRVGQDIKTTDTVELDGQPIALPRQTILVMLNKPEGYICSRDGQGNPTIYDLLPKKYHSLKPVGRLDRDSSGLLLLTNDGKLAHELTHPSFQKSKVYEIELHHNLNDKDKQEIMGKGVLLEDGPSKFRLDPMSKEGNRWQVTMQEGRNRQIRRTFQALGYRITKLHRTNFGPYNLASLNIGTYQPVNL